MIVNFEFLGDEPIENVITCMKYKIDKVICFGHEEVLEDQSKNTSTFLKKYCGVKQVDFLELSDESLQSVLRVMRQAIKKEIEAGNEIYFDVTGGESLILVAFGMLSKEFETPMHMFDIPDNRLIELDDEGQMAISKKVPEQHIRLDLDRYIEMQGGVINNRLHKENKAIMSSEFDHEVEQIWSVAHKYWKYWNPFSGFLARYMAPDEDLTVRQDARYIANKIRKSTTKLNDLRIFHSILDALAMKGLLLGLQHADGRYYFRFKNEWVSDCILEGGSVLELHTFQQERKNSDDCRVGVHIDWDGIIHNDPCVDVLNEIDVLTLKGNICNFISCKSGRMDKNQPLQALYELQTVAERFGGKYAKKVLVTANPIGQVYLDRAEEMEIEVRQMTRQER